MYLYIFAIREELIVFLRVRYTHTPSNINRKQKGRGLGEGAGGGGWKRGGGCKRRKDSLKVEVGKRREGKKRRG